jgi:hypothetical protein
MLRDRVGEWLGITAVLRIALHWRRLKLLARQ